MLGYFVKKENILNSTIFFTAVIALLSLSVAIVFSILFFGSINAETVFISIILPLIMFPLLLHSLFTAYFKLNEMERELHASSKKDLQTGVWSRHYFLELAEKEFFTAKRYKDFFSVLICELENVKSLNEKYGHSAGDKMITEFARILNKNIRATDIAARYESKRFALLLPKIDAAGVVIAVERLKKIIDQSSVFIFEDEVKYAIAVGAATFEEEMQDLKEVLFKAEESLAKAKRP